MDGALDNVDCLFELFVLVEVVFASNDSQFPERLDTVASSQDESLSDDRSTTDVAVPNNGWDPPLKGDLVWEFSGPSVDTIGDSGYQAVGGSPADYKSSTS